MNQAKITYDELMQRARLLHDAGMKGPQIAKAMEITIGRVHRLISKSYLIERGNGMNHTPIEVVPAPLPAPEPQPCAEGE